MTPAAIAFEQRVYTRVHRLLSQIPDTTPGAAIAERLEADGSTALVRLDDGALAVVGRTADHTPEDPAMSRVVVLWRQPDTLWLWAIPYTMRPTQSPHHILERYRGDWQRLLLPMDFDFAAQSPKTQRSMASLERVLRPLGIVPENPMEWIDIQDPEGIQRAQRFVEYFAS